MESGLWLFKCKTEPFMNMPFGGHTEQVIPTYYMQVDGDIYLSLLHSVHNISLLLYEENKAVGQFETTRHNSGHVLIPY